MSPDSDASRRHRGYFHGMAKHPKRPRDPNQLAHMVVRIATGEAEEASLSDGGKNPAAVELGRRGGLMGGKARAEKLTPDQRAAAARLAAQARWRRRTD